MNEDTNLQISSNPALHIASVSRCPFDFEVISIERYLTHDWLLNKHYAGTLPNLMYCFGLFDNKQLKGVCCFGTPANNHNNEMGKFKQIELVRLVINDDLPKNTASYFISKCFKFLPMPLSLISYADSGNNHHGYVYQATNWIYTGLGGGDEFFIDKDKNEIHGRTMSLYRKKHKELKRHEIAELYNWTPAKSGKKHRYLYFIGNKRDKKQWIKEVLSKYKIESYPKCDNQRYDSSYKPVIQQRLF